jgi:hypothetical protein
MEQLLASEKNIKAVISIWKLTYQIDSSSLPTSILKRESIVNLITHLLLIMNSMKERGFMSFKNNSISVLFSVCIFLAASAGCSRYAPTTPTPPKRTILEITLKTAAPVADNFYYYIAFDTSNPLSPEGPLPILSGAERGKNWTYYIRLYNGAFTEKVVNISHPIDDDPVPFDFNSPRHFQASFSNNTIYVSLYLDKLATGTVPLSFNFITSELPVTPTQDPIPAIDYLNQPKIIFTPGISADDSLYPLQSGHSVSDQYYLPADITHWYIDTYDK